MDQSAWRIGMGRRSSTVRACSSTVSARPTDQRRWCLRTAAGEEARGVG